MLIGRAKKKSTRSQNVQFSLKISMESKKKVFVVRDEVPHFLRGRRLQPAWPVDKSGPDDTIMTILSWVRNNL